jgi:hypothetical protein
MRDGHKEDRGVTEDLEELKTVVATQGRRIRAAETAAAASAVVGPLQSALQIAAPKVGNNPIVKAGLPLVPLLLLILLGRSRVQTSPRASRS